MSKNKIFIAGHKGKVGSALVRLLQKKDVELLLEDRKDLDLLNQKKFKNFLKIKE